MAGVLSSSRMQLKDLVTQFCLRAYDSKENKAFVKRIKNLPFELDEERLSIVFDDLKLQFIGNCTESVSQEKEEIITAYLHKHSSLDSFPDTSLLFDHNFDFALYMAKVWIRLPTKKKEIDRISNDEFRKQINFFARKYIPIPGFLPAIERFFDSDKGITYFLVLVIFAMATFAVCLLIRVCRVLGR